MIDSSSSSPPTRIDCETTMPPSEMTATSDVPPPMSTTMLPVGSPTGRPAPIAAAIGSSMRYAWGAPAQGAASSPARALPDQVRPAPPRREARLLPPALLHPGDSRGDADDDARMGPPVLVHL